ncbi:unnamed protein product, partial [Mesorhabditis spiculigera]
MAAARVLAALVDELKPCLALVPLNRTEMKMKSAITGLLRRMEEPHSWSFEEEDEDLYEEDEADNDFPVWSTASGPITDEIRFGKNLIPEAEVKKAVQFFRSPKKGSRPLHVMNKCFRWISNEHHLTTLREYQKGKKNYSLEARRKQLLDVLKEQVKDGMQRGLPWYTNDEGLAGKIYEQVPHSEWPGTYRRLFEALPPGFIWNGLGR